MVLYPLWHGSYLQQELVPEYVEIVTWNDYGESHYVTPLSSPHTDDGGSKWVNDMPHDGWLDMAKPFISAYKNGSTTVSDYINTTMGTANNMSGNYFNGCPNSWETLTDEVFVVSLLTANGTVTVNSRSTEYSYDALAGASAFSVPMGVGAQAFALTRDGGPVMNGTSLKEIVLECVYGIYNFNAYVRTVPARDSDSLQADGLAALTSGLAVACEATPSLPATAPATVAVTATATPTPAPTVSV